MGPVQLAVPEWAVFARYIEAGRLPDEPISRRFQRPGDRRRRLSKGSTCFGVECSRGRTPRGQRFQPGCHRGMGKVRRRRRRGLADALSHLIRGHLEREHRGAGNDQVCPGDHLRGRLPRRHRLGTRSDSFSDRTGNLGGVSPQRFIDDNGLHYPPLTSYPRHGSGRRRRQSTKGLQAGPEDPANRSAQLMLPSPLRRGAPITNSRTRPNLSESSPYRQFLRYLLSSPDVTRHSGCDQRCRGIMNRSRSSKQPGGNCPVELVGHPRSIRPVCARYVCDS